MTINAMIPAAVQPAPGATLRVEELLTLVALRQPDALAQLYDRYGRLVFGIALRIVGDYSGAEEVTQDVFQHVWQSATGFNPASGSGCAWLIGIARHRAIDATRSRRFRTRAREERLLFEHPDDEAHSPQHYADQQLLRDLVRSALAQLPGAQREAIELAYYGGLTYPEIAARVGAPCGTIKTRVRLGIRKLRTLLLEAEERGARSAGSYCE